MKNLIYFTSGEWIEDASIRRQVIRVPEVMNRVSRAQEENGSWDLFSSFLQQESFERLSHCEKTYLANVVQQGLFERWIRRHNISVDEVLRRSNFKNISEVAQEIKKIGEGDRAEPAKVFVVGPGLDELSFLFKNSQSQFDFIEVIDQDPALYWFWPEVKEAEVSIC